MKIHLLTIAFGSTLLVAANAALITYDGFAYTPGQSLTSQPNWSAIGSGDSITVASGNLTVTGLQPATGNLVNFTGDGADARLTFAPQTTDTYFSLAFRITDSALLDTAGGYFASFSDGASKLGSLVWLRSHGSGRYDIGGSVSPTSTIGWNTNEGNGFQVGLTMFLIASYEFLSGSNDDTTNIWFTEDPFLGSLSFGGPAPGSAIQVAGGVELTQVSAFTLTQLSSTGTPTIQIDELRVGHSYAEVSPVPEPSTVSLFAGAASLLLARRRRSH